MTTSNETTNSTALAAVNEALSNGEPINLTINLTPTADGAGIAFTGTVTTPGGQTTSKIIPPLIPLPMQPPTVAPTPPPTPGASSVPPATLPTAAATTTTTPSAPAQFATVTHPIPIPPTLKTQFPYPTNAWWENIILGKNRIAPEPYQIQVVDNGFLACYPTQSFAQDSFGMQHITTQFLQNMSLEFAETMGSWAVTKYDDLTVSLKWTAENGNSATSIVAQGCPYLSMAYTNTTPLITTQHQIVSINDYTNMGPYTGNKFKIGMNNGQTWVVYCSSTINITVSGSQMQATAPFSGVIRIAVLVNASDESILDQYVTPIPTGGTMSAQYGNNNIAYTFTWNTAGPGTLLMCALPHHMDILHNPQTVNTSYRSMKGLTTGIVGNSWTLVEPMPTITWTAPRAINPAYKDAIAAQLKKDANLTVTDLTNTYEGGKQLSQLARLALIADEIGDITSASTIRSSLKTALTAWLTGTNGNPFVYDKTWGGVCSKQALINSSAQYGSGWYNDHQYHYGYVVYAAASLAKEDSAWMSSYKDRIDDLVGDYCNFDASNTNYTLHRHKDMYAGHSWAAGLFDFGDNRDQESTSESINAYAAMALWGLVTGNTPMQNYGALALVTEVRSAIKYWHTYPGNNVYGSQWTNGGASLMWQAGKVDDSTWFASELSCRRGIQVIPITQFSSLYLEPAWVRNMVSIGEMTKMQSENFGIWPTFTNSLLAVVDKQTALNNINALSDTQIDPGTSKTNLLWWVAIQQ